MKRFERVARKAAFALAGICLFFMLLEAFSRLYLGLGTPPLYVADPEIEYMLKPNQNLRRFGNQISTNAYSMRSGRLDEKRPTDELRILVFGDSVVNGGALTSDEHLATNLARDALLSRGFGRVFVGNVSAGSWGPGNWLAYVKRFGTFESQIVILVISSHDYADNPTFDPLNPNTHPTRNPPAAFVEGFVRYLPRYLHFGAEQEPPPRLPSSAEVARGLGDLRAFIDLVEENKAQLIVLQHAELHELVSAKFDEGHDKIRRVLIDSAVPAFDEVEFGIGKGNCVISRLYRDEIHLSNEGQLILGRIVVELVTSQLEHRHPRPVCS